MLSVFEHRHELLLPLWLCHGGYVFVVVCLSVCLSVSVCLLAKSLATLCTNCQTDLHEIFREGSSLAMGRWTND